PGAARQVVRLAPKRRVDERNERSEDDQHGEAPDQRLARAGREQPPSHARDVQARSVSGHWGAEATVPRRASATMERRVPAGGDRGLLTEHVLRKWHEVDVARGDGLVQLAQAGGAAVGGDEAVLGRFEAG